MALLYTLGQNAELTKTEEFPFSSELDDMEPFIKKNSEIIGDVIIFGEQTFSGGRDKITDLLAVNRDGDVLVIELKNTFVGIEILPQILKYRNYWKNNLEAVKNLWFQSPASHKDIKPDWTNYDPEIVLIANGFDDELVEIVNNENLPIKFIQISRYSQEKSTFILVDVIESKISKVKQVISKEEYNWEWYLNYYDDNQINIAKNIDEQITQLSNQENWGLTRKFNKWYISYKIGFWNVFGIEFPHKGKASFFLNIKSEDFGRNHPEWERNKNWGYWYKEIDDPNFNINILRNILEEVYRKIEKSK